MNILFWLRWKNQLNFCVFGYRIKTASLRNINIEQDLYGYAIQASSNLEEISVNGKLLEVIISN